jgi:very-short-patch-repair endonuclease
MANKFFSDDDYENLTWQEMAEKLPNRVKEVVYQELGDKALCMFFIIDDCESPIEMLMGIALNKHDDRCRKWSDDGSCFIVEQQFEVNVSGKTYRVDFLVRAQYKGQKYDIVVECDGHDFHEKSKKQVAKDKRRDRDLIKNGFTVMRFTGSEIYKDPDACAREVISLIFPFVRR